MFLNDLFTIQSETTEAQTATIRIRLNAEHAIYTGHFPNDAITPGVCVVQIAVDLFSHLQGHTYTLDQAKNIKFINIIKPNENPEVAYHLSWEPAGDGCYTLKVVVENDGTTFSKISAIVKIQDPTI